MATYPTENSASTTPMTMNASGMPISPVTAKPWVTTPATTVSGVAALITKKMTDGTPSRSSARAIDMLLGAGLVCAMGTPGLDCRGKLHPVMHHGFADRRLGLGDEHPQRPGQA